MIVFYLPYKIDKTRPSTPNIRPLKLLGALQKYDEVVFISGPLGLRILKTIKTLFLEPNFIFYWESSSTNLISSNFRGNLGLGFLDYFNIMILSAISIKSNCFIRDVHWYFDNINSEWSKQKRMIYKLVGYFENWLFVSLANRIFLPSIEMQEFLGVKIPGDKVVEELPSGVDMHLSMAGLSGVSKFRAESVRLLYVGGLSEVYDLRPLLELTAMINGELIICTRESDYRNKGGYIQPFLSKKIRVVHESGEGLSSYFNWAHYGCLYFEPIEYHKFMMPYKLMEYALANLPILSSTNSKFGKVIRENKIGLQLSSNVNEAAEELLSIGEIPYLQFQENLEDFIARNCWDSRAKILLNG